MTSTEIDLKHALRLALDYIDAIPKEAADKIRVFSERDWIESLFAVDRSPTVNELELWRSDHWIEGIRDYRARTGSFLKDAKETFEKICPHGPSRYSSGYNEQSDPPVTRYYAGYDMDPDIYGDGGAMV